MTSDYKYKHIIRDKDKVLIPFLLAQGKSIKYICEKYGLSKRFISNKYYHILNSKKSNLGAKMIPYYEDEDSYGKQNYTYNYEDLSKSEKDL